jgi:hypothetical protein
VVVTRRERRNTVRARARFAAALTMLALMGGIIFAGSLSALMHPLIAAVTQLDGPR